VRFVLACFKGDGGEGVAPKKKKRQHKQSDAICPDLRLKIF
jgi:hypothetical protein